MLSRFPTTGKHDNVKHQQRDSVHRLLLACFLVIYFLCCLLVRGGGAYLYSKIDEQYHIDMAAQRNNVRTYSSVSTFAQISHFLYPVHHTVLVSRKSSQICSLSVRCMGIQSDHAIGTA